MSIRLSKVKLARVRLAAALVGVPFTRFVAEIAVDFANATIGNASDEAYAAATIKLGNAS